MRTMLCLAATVVGLSALGACSSGDGEAAEPTTPDTAPAVIEDLETENAALATENADLEAANADLEAANAELSEQVETAEGDFAEAQSQRESAESARDTVQAERDAAIKRAKTAERTLQRRTARLDARQAGLDQRQAEVKQREADVAAREQAVTATEDAIEANSFGDGVYAVGTDIVAGTYHTDGGDGCYYAEYGADGTDIIDNGFTDAGPATVIIDSPFFESSDCGTWTLVG